MKGGICMARPSIFSREYERRMRKRKMRAALIFVFLLMGTAAFLLIKGNIGFDKLSTKLLTDTNKKASTESTVTKSESAPLPAEETKEKAIDVVLNAVTKVKVQYEENNGVNVFKSIFTENPSISFVLNPSASGMVIIDNKLQSMWYINNSGTAVEITNPSFKSYSKESTLQKRPDYIWCSSPKFIDNDNIVYLSQLPYIGRSTKKYVWAANVNNKDSHTYKTTLGGETVSFGNITDKGLEVIIGNFTKYMTYNGESIKVVK
jgi:hypothetical protein